ncbi:pyruvate:ferredoxin (flavodoxin) oxidoreductase [Enterobacter hormaechei]|uniref:pyruvate:ferredoxin (flavodoxin) oxidoreductase n=1 Tax=Enterobacter hormaechei TaxID=158836 RepID=UPI003752AFF8
MQTIDGNGAVASVAFRTSEVIAIYPITPSSTMAEQADAWAGNGVKNVWGDVPRVVEMQSEAGAIATVHGALQTGALSTSFTSSQGLLLMIPTLYKLAGQLTPFVLHVAARTVATHALSIFGDHSDVMAVRQTGCAMLCASSVQEAQDFALISHIATLKSRVPFIHFFDGFRTSHEINKIVPLPDDTLLNLLPQADIDAHRARALNPEHPVIRGTSANPDTYFQSREATNPWYNAVYEHVERAMDDFAAATGREYKPFEYYGHPQAERVIVLMGSAIGTCEEVVDALLTRGEKVGVLKVRLYRPFSAKHLLAALPDSARAVAVLDRTKEPGAQAEPLYLDVMTALAEAFNSGERETLPRVIGGRYGLSSKEFGPECVLAVFTELRESKPKPRFTVGIYDDVTNLSLPLPENTLPSNAKLEALFYGLGSDGSVSATKNNIKIIGNSTPWYAQGYFVYDSKKAGGLTVSHLRVSEHPIRSAYLISQADFVGCHQLQFIDKYQMAERLKPGGIFLINTPYSADEVWARLPQEVQAVLNQKQARLYVINAAKIARECGLAARINTVMQMAFFHLTNILPGDSALMELQGAIAKSYSSKGQELVERNWQALALARESLFEVPLQPVNASSPNRPPVVSDAAPDFVKTVTAGMLAGLGDTLPVSALPPDGTWPMGTTRWEKRNIAEAIPIWKEELCTQCNHCVAACPHSAIRAKVVSPEALAAAPESLHSLDVKSREVEKSVWLIGGDGWAYDIGFGGLDHVLSLTENVNILVLDTQCYSNTGGQASKATPLGAVTKFGEHGKRKARKDLGVSMMMYGHVYVAQISLGAQLNQTVKAIQEAEAYPGPSLIIAYSPCEEHGYDLALSHDQMRQLTATGFWPLYRFDPRRADEGKLPLALDSRPPSDALAETLLQEQRFRRLNAQQPEVAEQLWKDAAADLQKRYDFLAQLAGKAEKSTSD